MKTVAGFSLTVSLEKTKLLIMEKQLMPEDIQLDASKIITVDNFTYFGSNIIKDGEVAHEVGLRLGKATRTFDCLRLPTLGTSNLACRSEWMCTIQSCCLS